jgi:cytochrome c-type biogenesis protein CcmF
MNYIGEHLLPGQLGHFFILLSLVSSLGATVAYFFHVQSREPDQKAAWRKLARLFFFAEVVSVFLILVSCTTSSPTTILNINMPGSTAAGRLNQNTC